MLAGRFVFGLSIAVLCATDIYADAAKKSRRRGLVAGQQGEECRTNEGQPGTCLPSFDCEAAQRDRGVQMKECRRIGFFTLICCPKKSGAVPGPVTTDPQNFLKKFRVPGCGIRETSDLRTILIKRSAIKERSSVAFQPLIVGGKEAKAHSWPWMVAIYTNNRGVRTFLCGGAIIDNKHILTAAHCFRKTRRKLKISPGRFSVRLGEHNLADRNIGEQLELERVTLHEDYQPPAEYYDIAILRVKGTINFKKEIKPICLPVGTTERNSNLVGKKGTVIGWGTLEFAGRDSAVLRQVTIPVTKNSECDTNYKSLGPSKDYPRGITPDVMCAGNLLFGGKDACQGDSGGPLMILDSKKKWTLAGVVSGGYQCARKSFPGIYTRVTHYLEWIAKNILA